MRQQTKDELEKEKLKHGLINETDYNELRIALNNKIINDLTNYWKKAFKRFWKDFITQDSFKKLPRDYRTKLYNFYRENTFSKIIDLLHYEINELVIQILFREGKRFRTTRNLKDFITIPSWKDKRELIKNFDKIAKDYRKSFMKRLITWEFLPLLVQLHLVRDKLNWYTIEELMKNNKKQGHPNNNIVGMDLNPNKEKERFIKQLKEAVSGLKSDDEKINKSTISKKINTSRPTLYKMLNKHGIDLKDINFL